MLKANSKILMRYDEAYILSLTDSELIDLCRNPPTDLEFNELRIAADVLADRYRHALTMLDI